MSLVLSRSEHMEHNIGTTTSKELAVATASASTTKLNTSAYPPNTPGAASAKSLFSGATIGKIEGCSFTFNIVDDSNKDKNPRKRRVIISDDSDSDWETCLTLQTLVFEICTDKCLYGADTTLIFIDSFSDVFQSVMTFCVIWIAVDATPQNIWLTAGRVFDK